MLSPAEAMPPIVNSTNERRNPFVPNNVLKMSLSNASEAISFLRKGCFDIVCNDITFLSFFITIVCKILLKGIKFLCSV